MSTPLRVGFDLDGSLESLGNSMADLADALIRDGECELVRFHSLTRAEGADARVRARLWWRPWWRRSRGAAIDRLLGGVDVVHVAGPLTPPTKRAPLIISVDDLRPLRGETREYQRVTQLRRAVRHGATLVASTRSASHEVLEVLNLERSRVVVVPPAVPLVSPTLDGDALVVNVTGAVRNFLDVAPGLLAVAKQRGAKVVAVTSESVSQRISAAGLDVTSVRRRDARQALARARVVLHVSDGARFPSFAVAALSAGVPTVARATTINRELLNGAAALAERDEDLVALVEDVWDRDARRALMIAAGRARAQDFAPATAARAYAALYSDVVRGWTS